MQDLLADLPAWAPTALNVVAVVAAVLPLVAYVGRRVATGRWRLVVGTRAWRVAVALLVACPAVIGFAIELSGLVADAQRLAGQDRQWAQERVVRDDERLVRELQDRYQVNLQPDGYPVPWSVDEPVPVEIISPGAPAAGHACEIVLRADRVRDLVGPDADHLLSSDVTFTEFAGAHAVHCDGAELEPQDALLGVPVRTELVERSWPGHRVPRALAGGVLAGGGIGLLVVFMAYALGVVARSDGRPTRGDALLADLRERIDRDPAEGEAVIDAVAAFARDIDEQRAKEFAAAPLEDLLVTPDAIDLTDAAFLTEYLVDKGLTRRPATRDPEEAERTADRLEIAVEWQRTRMAEDPSELERVRRYAADLVDRLNDEIRAQREAGLAGTFVSTGIDRDAVVLTDDLLREHLIATGEISAVDMVVPGHRTYMRGFVRSLLFAPVIGLLAWVMTATDEGEVQWRWEAVATAENVAELVAHYEALGVDVELPADRVAEPADQFFNAVEGTRGTDTCFGWVVSGRALLQCGPARNERAWT